MRPVMSPSPAARRWIRSGRHSGIQMPKNQNPQLLKSGLKIGCTQLPL
jgi:hypothetical protein